MFSKTNISFGRQKFIVYIVLTAITLAVYWQVYHYQFINFDDPYYITQNSNIQSGITLEGIRWAFSSTYTGLWNPLIWLSLMLDYKLYNLNAGGYHLTNLFLHMFSTILLFWLFNRMTKEIWKSAFVATFFALHPLHVESVAWISERKDVLSGFFWMLTLCLYVYFTEKPAVKRYLFVTFSFVLALMSKPMVVTLPLIMILLDYWPLSRWRIGIESKEGSSILWQLKEKILFFVLSAAVVMITLHNPNNPNVLDGAVLKQFPLISRIANAPIAFITYLGKTFWPYDMAIIYPFTEQIHLLQLIGTSLLILIITIFVIAMTKRIPYIFTGWLWFMITVLPVIGIIQISLKSPYTVADRYHYLPSIGIAMMLAWGIPSLIKSQETGKKILFTAAIAVTILMAALTWKQCGYWKNSYTLFSHTLRVTKNNPLAHNNLGLVLAEEGKINEAIYHYNKAISITPNHYGYYNNRGNVFSTLGKNQLAFNDFNTAIQLKPDYIEAFNNRGTLYGKTGQHQLAIEDFSKAISINPNYIMAYYNRGISYNNVGKYQLAIEDYNKAIRMKTDYADAWNNRAFSYFNQDNKILGCGNAEKACKLGNCKTLKWAQGNGLCRQR